MSESASNEPQLSQAELRRRRILAKKGTRMALVTGDQTLAASDTNNPPVTSSARLVSEIHAPAPALSPEPTTTINNEPISHTIPERYPVPTRSWRLPQLPVAARVSLIVLCGVSVPFVRVRLWEHASAFQLFMAIEALIVAPELVSWTEVGLLGAAVGAAKQMAAMWRDTTLFLFALFTALRATA